MKVKIISIFTLIALLFSICSVTALSASSVDIVKYYGWKRRGGLTNQDFSLAFVGDIQTLTYYNDYKKGTNYVDTLFTWIADNADEKRIKHVFTLGDLTDRSSVHDPTLSYGASDPIKNDATYDKEWEIVKGAISKLDGIVPYSVVRGNHDSYNIDDFFRYDEYTKNFDGFYREDAGVYKSSITNSYRLLEIEDIKFIFITIDFNPSRDVVAWVDELLGAYSEYNAIITMHSFLTFSNEKLTIAGYTDIRDSIVQGQYKGAAPDWIWNNCLKNHSNVIMTVSGHVGTDVPQALTTVGVNGNKVLNVLVDPQFYDLNIAPTGAVFLMHFYDGGKTVKTEYYSTAHDAYRNEGSYTWSLDLIVSESDDTAEESTATTTATPATSSDASLKISGCKASVALLPIALMPIFAMVTITAIRRKKED